MFARYLLAIALFSASLATGQDLHSKLQKAFEFQCKQKLFMGAVAIKQKGATVFEAACGFANAEWQVPNAIDTEFRIGSITKQFTAVAILLLHQDGKLELTDTIGTWVPDLPQSWRSATLHQLLTHTSGIPNYTAAVNSAELKRLNRLGATPRELIDLANRTPLMFPPGSKVSYSNTGYILLGMVIEKAAGMPFEHFVQTRILGPLQLNHTGYDDAKQVLEHRASGYVLTEGKLENTDPVDASVPWSAGGFYSTIGDLSVWMQSLVQGRLLNTQSTDLMFHAYPETLLQGVHYGYGIVLGERFGHRLEYYAGGIDGFSSVLQLYPDVDLNLIVMSNLDPRTASAPAWTVADGLAAVILGK